MAFVIRGQEVRLGRLISSHCKAKLSAELYLDSFKLPAMKPSDWTVGIPEWGPMANNVYGNCVVAMLGHSIQIATKFGTGNMVVPPDAEIINTYFALTGGRDVGLDITDTLDWLGRNGNNLSGQGIDGWGTLDFRNTKLLAVACQVFGPLTCGVQLPNNFADEINQHKPWADMSYPPNPNNGHAIPIVGASKDGLVTVTWGIRQVMTWQWAAKYISETQVPLWKAWRGKLNPSQIDETAFIDDYRQITGQKPITPPPAPPSPPQPPPVPPGPVPHPVGDSVGIDVIVRLMDGRTGHAIVDNVLVG